VNRAFLVIAVPAALVITAYILLAVYAGVQLTYFRVAGGAVGFIAAIYLVRAYHKRHKSRASSR
jgi:small neutral amino acid transporter SnatA (MarC family)